MASARLKVTYHTYVDTHIPSKCISDHLQLLRDGLRLKEDCVYDAGCNMLNRVRGTHRDVGALEQHAHGSYPLRSSHLQ